ncbi:hypothetical protein DLE01_11280, partial [Streptomyces sp. FT05W]
MAGQSRGHPLRDTEAVIGHGDRHVAETCRGQPGSGGDAAAVTTDTNLGPAELAKVSGDKKLAARVGTGHF